MKKDMNRQVWEGWTVAMFINELATSLQAIQSGNSWKKPMRSREELENWCKDNQPYYKETIPEVVDYFAGMYGLE